MDSALWLSPRSVNGLHMYDRGALTMVGAGDQISYQAGAVRSWLNNATVLKVSTTLGEKVDKRQPLSIMYL